MAPIIIDRNNWFGETALVLIFIHGTQFICKELKVERPHPCNCMVLLAITFPASARTEASNRASGVPQSIHKRIPDSIIEAFPSYTYVLLTSSKSTYSVPFQTLQQNPAGPRMFHQEGKYRRLQKRKCNPKVFNNINQNPIIIKNSNSKSFMIFSTSAN